MEIERCHYNNSFWLLWSSKTVEAVLGRHYTPCGIIDDIINGPCPVLLIFCSMVSLLCREAWRWFSWSTSFAGVTTFLNSLMISWERHSKFVSKLMKPCISKYANFWIKRLGLSCTLLCMHSQNLRQCHRVCRTLALRFEVCEPTSKHSSDSSQVCLSFDFYVWFSLVALWWKLSWPGDR